MFGNIDHVLFVGDKYGWHPRKKVEAINIARAPREPGPVQRGTVCPTIWSGDGGGSGGAGGGGVSVRWTTALGRIMHGHYYIISKWRGGAVVPKLP